MRSALPCVIQFDLSNSYRIFELCCTWLTWFCVFLEWKVINCVRSKAHLACFIYGLIRFSIRFLFHQVLLLFSYSLQMLFVLLRILLFQQLCLTQAVVFKAFCLIVAVNYIMCSWIMWFYPCDTLHLMSIWFSSYLTILLFCLASYE